MVFEALNEGYVGIEGLVLTEIKIFNFTLSCIPVWNFIFKMQDWKSFGSENMGIDTCTLKKLSVWEKCVF